MGDLQRRVRLAELLAALSLGIDLGFGQPMEHVLRQCRIALRLGEQCDLAEGDRVAAYYSALLINVGCHTDAHEQAYWFGDDIALKSTKYEHDPYSAADLVSMVRMLGSGSTPLHRVRVAVDFVISGRKELDGMIAGHAALARGLAAELGLPDRVCAAVAASYERWDGRGYPGRLAGEAIPLGARVTQLAEFVEVEHRQGGIDAVKALARRRAGTQFDPALVDMLCNRAEKIFHGLDEIGSWDVVIDDEPALSIVLSPGECTVALAAIARFVDLKSPWLIGHSIAVAELVARAAVEAGLDPVDAEQLFQAGLVQGFGRLGVSNAIWDKDGPLTTSERERVRMHPYLTERMLEQSETLAPLGRLAGQYRERLDGSGYPRGLAGNAISRSARLLAVADAYQAMREPRPYREARSAADAAEALRVEVKRGRFDAVSVDAVLRAAGHRVSRRREGPDGLTPREVEVLRLLAVGMSNKAVATRLGVTPKTVGNHVEHIYTKIGVSSRAAAGLYAMQRGILPEEQFDAGPS